MCDDLSAVLAFLMGEASLEAGAAAPTYQVQFPADVGTSAWRDASEEAYHTFMPEHRRIVYLTPQSQVATYTAGVDLSKLQRWTFDGGMTAEASKEGQWVYFKDIERVALAQQAAAPAPAQEAAHADDRVLKLLNHIEDVVDDANWGKIDPKLWNAVTTGMAQAQQAGAAAPAGDAEDARAIQFALELAEHENDDAAMSFLKAWSNEDAGYLHANWPDFGATEQKGAA